MEVPNNIFELLPRINDVRSFTGLGGQFKIFKTLNIFSIKIVFSVSSDSYYSDDPLEIKLKRLDQENIGSLDLSKYGINKTIDELTQRNHLLDTVNSDNVQRSLDEAKEDIDKTISGLNDDPENLPKCPEKSDDELQAIMDDNTSEVNIYDNQGNIIRTVKTVLSSTEYTCKASQDANKKLRASILNNLPTPKLTNNRPETTDPLCQIPDSDFKNQVNASMTAANLTTSYAQDPIKNISNSMTDIGSTLRAQIESFSDNKTLEEIQEAHNKESVNLLKTTLPQYGIPILQINLEHNIIINIVNGELQVLNFDKYIASNSDLENQGTDLTKRSLKIDVLENPDARILPDIKYEMTYSRKFNTHTLTLKKYYSDELFTDTEISEIDTGLFYLGMDKSGLKQFCGRFYEISAVDTLEDITRNTFNKLKFPNIPGALAFYDFYNAKKLNEDDTRIIYNNVYPFNSLMSPLAMRDDWVLESKLSGNYTFTNHSVIDDFFCKDKFTNRSFNISICLKRNAEMDISKKVARDREVLLADPINDNFIWYNENESELTIEFHGYTYKVDINFVINKWFMISFSYDYPNQKCLIDIIYKETDEVLSTTESISHEFYLDDDLKTADNKRFQLLSLFGEYSFNEKKYINKFDTLCGPIILFKRFLDTAITKTYFTKFYPILYYYRKVGSIYTDTGILPNYTGE